MGAKLGLTLREKQRLMVFENRVLREMAGGWRKLHNEEFNHFYSSLNILGMVKSSG
jgi:hypothetical protein